MDPAPAPFEVAVYDKYCMFTDPLRLPERMFTVNGADLIVRQDWGEDGRGGTELGFGAGVQHAAIVLTEYLEKHFCVQKKRVLELGTGPGLVSLAAMRCGAQEVVATDGDIPLLCSLVAQNCDLNFQRDQKGANEDPQENCSSSSPSPSPPLSLPDLLKCRWHIPSTSSPSPSSSSPCALRVAPLLWGNEEHHKIVEGDYDVVIAADIVGLPYVRHFGSLVATLSFLCPRHSSTKIVLAYKKRHHVEDRFFSLMKKQGFCHVEIQGEEKWKELGVFIYHFFRGEE